MNAPASPLVLGIGNLLMGDEGVGVHAVHRLERVKLPEKVTLLDGGTGGFHLLSLIQEHTPVILIDATMDGKPAGTVSLTRPKYASDFPRTLSAHDIGLRDLLESATLMGPLPTMYLITVSIAEIQSMRMELSPSIEQSLPQVVTLVMDVLAQEGMT